MMAEIPSDKLKKGCFRFYNITPSIPDALQLHLTVALPGSVLKKMCILPFNKSEFYAYLSVPVSVRAEPGLQPGPAAAVAAAPADSDCPPRYRCRCAASLPPASPSGCL